MCGLCGVLGGGEHWTDGQGIGSGSPAPRRAERLRRVSVANAALAHYGLQVSDWHGVHYLLSSRTGRTEIVDNLTHVWQAAERILRRPCDPLDPALVERLEQEV